MLTPVYCDPKLIKNTNYRTRNVLSVTFKNAYSNHMTYILMNPSHANGSESEPEHSLQLKKISSFNEDNKRQSTQNRIPAYYKRLKDRVSSSIYPCTHARYGGKGYFGSQVSLYKLFARNNIHLTNANKTIEAMETTSFL